MTKQEEIRQKIYHILKSEETIDTDPPYRCLPTGDNTWLTLKTTHILNYLHSQGVVIQSNNYYLGSDINGQAKAFFTVEPLIKEE